MIKITIRDSVIVGCACFDLTMLCKNCGFTYNSRECIDFVDEHDCDLIDEDDL